jgi:hypothetical protein
MVPDDAVSGLTLDAGHDDALDKLALCQEE